MRRAWLVMVCFGLSIVQFALADTNRFPLAGNPIFIGNPNPAISGSFGESAARFDADRFLVGGSTANGGAAFLFDNSGALLLSIPNPNSNTIGNPISGFGATVAPFDKDRILIGDDQAKRAYLYDTNGNVLAVFNDPVVNTSSGAMFGTAMSSLGPDRIAVGDAKDASGKGAVYIFDTNATLLVTATNSVLNGGAAGYTSSSSAWGGSLESTGDGRAIVGGLSGSLMASLIDQGGNVLTTFHNPDDGSLYPQFGRSAIRLTQSLVMIADPKANDHAGGGYLFNIDGDFLVSYVNRTDSAWVGVGMTSAAFGTENFALGGFSEETLGGAGSVALFYISGGPPAVLSQASTNEAGFGSSVAGVGTNMLLVGVKNFDNAKGLVKLYPLSLTLPDTHEPDDRPQLASPFRIGTNQTHTIHRPGDEDWVSFFALSNLTFTIKAEHVATNINIAIDVFRRSVSGRTIPVVLGHNQAGLGGEESIVLTNLVTGAHVVRYYATSNPFGGQFSKTQARTAASDYGDDAEYDIVILGPTPTALLVLVVDLLSENGESAPPDAKVTVDGNAPVTISGNALLVNGLSAGVHTVSVSVAAGYFGDEDPADPDQINNPDNVLFGNPRHVDVLGAGMSFAPFAYLPTAIIDANVRDALTGGPAEGVGLSFVAIGGILDGLTNSAHPLGAVYAEPWVTPPVGSFPTNVLIPATNWVLHLSGTGYVSEVVSNGLSMLGPDDDIELGDIFIAPIDLNSNGISDAWEMLHFGDTISADGDADMDGLSNLEEYLVGTQPTNATSRFAFDPTAAPGTNGLISFCWSVVQGRTYSLLTIDDLTTTNWVPGIGPWVAPSNGIYCWSDTGSTSVVSRTYRVNVLLP